MQKIRLDALIPKNTKAATKFVDDLDDKVAGDSRRFMALFPEHFTSPEHVSNSGFSVFFGSTLVHADK